MGILKLTLSFSGSPAALAALPSLLLPWKLVIN
ncbi:unnamed protein product [Linum tenue]|uniref:Uncharacterized protein n=1 Tax=Linum tenue TaxID=586396 RepID=A0AAV0JBB5_9ROSI|nr:unnamed protein product [Linum tenue]